MKVVLVDGILNQPIQRDEKIAMNKSKPTLMIIEDELDFRNMVSEELSRAGYSVLSTAKASEAIRILQNQKFACVLLDLYLQDGSGTSVIDSMRQDKGHPNHKVPIIIVSGRLSTEVVMEIKPSINGIFVKPFNLSDLVEKVKGFCPPPPPGGP